MYWRTRPTGNRSFLYHSSTHVEVALPSILVTVAMYHLMSFLRWFKRLRIRCENEVCASPLERIYYPSEDLAIKLICEPALLRDYSRLHMLQNREYRKLEPGRETGAPLDMPLLKVPWRIESDRNRFPPLYAVSIMVVW